ncbi:hypothetical protein NPIL_150331 [Nephila pilipes]|uniref:Uncharacterized protein n=1 Tax=Nephila pilipes TaxID=299642 RepID=A0A8X6PW14_NEPPI|nr:hypothetical protein NPIL_150331 [Nephila pilipes]
MSPNHLQKEIPPRRRLTKMDFKFAARPKRNGAICVKARHAVYPSIYWNFALSVLFQKPRRGRYPRRKKKEPYPFPDPITKYYIL